MYTEQYSTEHHSISCKRERARERVSKRARVLHAKICVVFFDCTYRARLIILLFTLFIVNYFFSLFSSSFLFAAFFSGIRSEPWINELDLSEWNGWCTQWENIIINNDFHNAILAKRNKTERHGSCVTVLHHTTVFFIFCFRCIVFKLSEHGINAE